ncbi:MAG TPA: sulfatase-like hydrolase/transferase [Sedimentisphaerales bacterium]|nr:sulfatase-like hydrolase/transferase [Sedimentisphaerales bacterium]
MKSYAQNRDKITRRQFVTRLGAGAAAVGLAGALSEQSIAARGSAAKAEPVKRPNILFLMSDQHRWDFMGCTSHPLVRTPNMDRLAAEGALFDAAYCHWPVCVPSRMSMITGRYAHSHGTLGNTYALPQDQQTIGGYLKTLGYRTAAIGKMHFVDEDQQHGFDDRVEKADYSKDKGTEIRNTKILARSGQPWGISTQTEDETYEHYIAGKTIEWLEKKGDKPFCVWCSFSAPHPPFVAPENFYKLYEGKVKIPPQPPTPNPFLKKSTQEWADLTDEQAPVVMTAYMASITQMDRNIGRVLEALEKLGLADNTVVSYTSDHGDMQWQHGRFGKMTMFDGAARIPMIMRYKRRIAGGIVRHEIVEHVDMYPTFCDLLGVPTPAAVQGRSLMPLLEGKTANWPNTAFIEMGNSVVVRASRYKCRFEARKALELYDLEKDPQEWDNLIGKPGSDKILAEMRQLLDDWWKRTQPDLRGQVKPYRSGKAAAKSAKKTKEQTGKRASKKSTADQNK